MIKNPEQKEFTYYYFVTGGKIIGQGANVIWDLKGEKIGEYSITVGIGNGEIIKEKIVTKKILLQYCDDCGMICSCPSLTVSGLSGIAQPGDILIFTANLSGGNQDRATFNWMVSAGTIIVGQGTSQILVKTSKDLAGQIVTATVEVGGLCSECPQTTQSATVKIK
ncbi:MAG: hypothetical protein K1X72_24335 [Pyrinomonadaceae bacterium]|nr:hypothetical protein [Pyrinomonadaceae bacterium]